jgi:hypothetical protein
MTASSKKYCDTKYGVFGRGKGHVFFSVKSQDKLPSHWQQND